jgi:hypothetical protein
VQESAPTVSTLSCAADVAYVYHVGPHFVGGRFDSAEWWREVRAAPRGEGFLLDNVDKLTFAIVDSSN